MYRSVRSSRVKISVEIVLELIKHGVQFGVVKFSKRRDFDGINEHGAFLLHRIERSAENTGDTFAEVVALVHDTDARTAQPAAIEKFRIVSLSPSPRNPGCGIGRIGACERTQKHGGIGDGAAHGAGRVLV